MSNDLFPDLEPSMSPKLRWLKKHNVTVERNQRLADDEELWEAWVWQRNDAIQQQEEFFEGLSGPYFAAANTEDEALYKLAVANEWRLWNEEQN